MTRRMLDGSIWSNEHFADLPPMARLLLIGIINLADDQGRMKAHPAYLRSQVFPYDDVALDDVLGWLARIEANDTVRLYEVDGKQYLQLTNWWQYQSHSFASPSEHPRPAGWSDRIRYTGKSRIIYTHGWVSSNGELLPDTCDMDGNPFSASGRKAANHMVNHVDDHVDDHVVNDMVNHVGDQLHDYDNDNDQDKDDDHDDRVRVTTPNHHHHPAPSAPEAERVYSTLLANNITRKQTPALLQTISQWVTDYPAEWIDEAIGVAAMARDPTPKYVAGILRNFATERGQPGAPSAGKRVVAVPSAAEGVSP